MHSKQTDLAEIGFQGDDVGSPRGKPAELFPETLLSGRLLGTHSKAFGAMWGCSTRPVSWHTTVSARLKIVLSLLCNVKVFAQQTI